MWEKLALLGLSLLTHSESPELSGGKVNSGSSSLFLIAFIMKNIWFCKLSFMHFNSLITGEMHMFLHPRWYQRCQSQPQ